MTNKQRQAAAVLKEKISQGEISSNDNNSNKFHSATLRRLMHQENIQKPSREAVLAKKKEIEVLKFRVMLLSQEKARSLASIRQKTEILKTLQDENVLIGRFSFFKMNSLLLSTSVMHVSMLIKTQG